MPETTDFDLDPIRPGAAPQLNTSTIGTASISVSQPKYVRMTEAIVRWLRFHFSVASYIEYPNLVDRVWTSGDSSPLIIASMAEFKPNNADQRPAILVDRLEQDRDMNHRSIGDQYHGFRQGNYAHFMNGAHVVYCLGGREGESEFLAAEVWRELNRFSPIMREKLCLLRLLLNKVGKRVQLVSEAQEVKDTYAIPILISYVYEESWKIRPLDEEEITAIQTIFG